MQGFGMQKFGTKGRGIDVTRDDCISLDRDDPLVHARGRFAIPGNVNYLDGNSLGALPRGVSGHVQSVVEQEWGVGLIRS